MSTQQTRAIRPICRACGCSIDDTSYITWNGVSFHNDHVPRHEPAWKTKDEIGRKVMEVSQVCAEGYTRAISEVFQTEAQREASSQCAIAASNIGYFILQSLGFSKEEIRVLRAEYQTKQQC